MAQPTTEKLICMGFLFFLSFGSGFGHRRLLDPVTDGEIRAGLVSNTGVGAGSGTGSDSGKDAEAGDANDSGVDGGMHSCSGFPFGSGIFSGPLGQITGTITVPGLGTITIPIIGVPLLNYHAISLKSDENTATSDLHDEWTSEATAALPTKTMESLSPQVEVFFEAPPRKTLVSASPPIAVNFDDPPKMIESPLPPDEVFGGGPMLPEEMSSAKPGTVSP